MLQVESDGTPKWYVIHTYSGYENKVKADLENTVKNRELEDYFFDIVVPMEEQIEIKNGKRKVNIKKVFPGYVLIKMIITEQTWYIVRNTTGVTGFVGTETEPVPLSEEEIKKLGFENILTKSDFEVNDKVQILEGSFKNTYGTIEKFNKDKTKVSVLVEMFGRETPVVLDLTQIQKV